MPDFSDVTERVFASYAKKDYLNGLRLSVKADKTFPKMRDRTLYWIACFQSLLGNSEDALSTLQDAVRRGYFWNKDALLEEPDLQPLHGDAKFNAVVMRSEELRKKAQRFVKPSLKVIAPKFVKGRKYPLLVTLHGRNGIGSDHARRWNSVRRLGVVCAVPQSSQLFQRGVYCWDDSGRAQKEVSNVVREVMRTFPIDSDSVLIGGTSQGGALAVKMALEQQPIRFRGFVVNVPAFKDVDSLIKLVPRAAESGLRGYIFDGEFDPGRERIERLVGAMDTANHPCKLVVQPKLGHDYPSDFKPKLARAVRFVLQPRAA